VTAVPVKRTRIIDPDLGDTGDVRVEISLAQLGDHHNHGDTLEISGPEGKALLEALEAASEKGLLRRATARLQQLIDLPEYSTANEVLQCCEELLAHAPVEPIETGPVVAMVVHQDKSNPPDGEPLVMSQIDRFDLLLRQFDVLYERGMRRRLSRRVKPLLSGRRPGTTSPQADYIRELIHQNPTAKAKQLYRMAALDARAQQAGLEVRDGELYERNKLITQENWACRVSRAKHLKFSQ